MYNQLGGGEQTHPVLGNQPPMPKATVGRYIHTNETGQEDALVPENYYGMNENKRPKNKIPSYESLIEQ